MTLRIQCPSCQRQFKVSEDLKGRTVECGACENQFRVEDEVVVAKREKYYPGEVHKGGLERYGRMPPAGQIPVGFQTAAYKENASAADVTPASPQRRVANGLGIAMLVLFAIVLVFGSQDKGLFQDMVHAKRILLSAFVVVVGGILILYGGFFRKKESILTAFTLGALVMVLSVVLPVPTTLDVDPGVVRSPVPNPIPPDPEQKKLTVGEVIELVGYTPIQSSIDNVGEEAVVALWAPTMKERFKYQIQAFLHRTAGTPDRPSFYRRGRGWLFVLEGTGLTISEVEALVERFGRVDDVYEDLRLLRVSVEGERLLNVTPEQRKKLTDVNHSAFYARNQSELDHINLDRVKEAAQRLADVQPLRFRPEIARRLVELLGEESDADFVEAICRALKVWSLPDDGAEKAASDAARTIMAKDGVVPRAVMEFLVAKKAPEAVSILEQIWVRDPNSWEALLFEMGPAAEPSISPHLVHKNRAVQQSAARLLRKNGSRASLPALRLALKAVGADATLRSLIEGAIEAIEAAPAGP